MNAFLANTDVYLKNFRRRVFSQNALSQKCIFAKVHFRRNVFSQKCIFAKVYFRNTVFSQKCISAEAINILRITNVALYRSNRYLYKNITNENWCSLQKQSIFYEWKLMLSAEAINILRIKNVALYRSNRYFLQKIVWMKIDALCRSNQYFTN